MRSVSPNSLLTTFFYRTAIISKEKTRKREIRGLLAASKETNCNNLFLITDFHRENITVEDKLIKIIPAYEWLIS